MKWHEQHEAFKRLAIQQGICRLEQLNQALPFGCDVPQVRVDKWLNKLLTIPQSFKEQRKYVNHFKLGADPEFVFANADGRTDARCLGLQQGLAFGADNNGRLTEVRPFASRSALEVTASILATLRWLAALYPKTLQYEWQSGVFLYGDGLGGHVHFGRKRPNRNLEIQALDIISEELLAIKAYNVREVTRRRQGDEHRQRYGLPGDYRNQIHGYEYRTFPSWLDSPELAFLILVLSKLAVHNPRLLQGYTMLPEATRHYQRIMNLLSYYKDVDDDARLALKMLAHTHPVHLGGDFKARWGIGPIVKVQNVKFIPKSIQPSREDIAEMFAYLSGEKALEIRLSEPTWKPLVPPAGYCMVLDNTSTYGAKGLGEMLWDIVQPYPAAYSFVNSRGLAGGAYFVIPKKLADILPIGWRQTCGHKVYTHNDASVIYSDEKAREPVHYAECRRILLETILPFWRISDVKPDSYQQWKANVRSKPPQRFYGELLFGSLENLPLMEIR